MTIGPSDLLSALQNGVVAIRDLTIQIRTAFPPISSPSTTAPSVGSITFTSSMAEAFAIITTSSGAAYSVALYRSS